MSFVYTPAKEQLLKATLDMDGHDIRVMLVMQNTTADTDQDAGTIAAIGTLDEFNGAGYSRQALIGEVVNRDDPNNRAEFDANDATFTGVGAGTRTIAGAVVFRFVTNDADSIPIAFIDTGGLNGLQGNGGDITIVWDVEGILQAT